MMRSLFAWVLVLMSAPAALAADPQWPGQPLVTRPWVRWWWPGSAVDPAGITAQLESMKAIGIGGVEVTPIYGARGAEARYRPFLSKEWMDAFTFAAREAQRLGLGIDMATGTGWPFGGPGVAAADGSMKLVLVDGRLTGVPTGMKVKRAAPGGEGRVLDPYSVNALSRYLEPFSAAFAGFPRDTVRAQFHDSFEYYDAGWTPALPAAFRDLNGYDIQDYAAAFAEPSPLDADTVSRVKGDYRRTLAKLHLDYVRSWVSWSHAHGFHARNQAHGAPGNLLDLYAAADIPETESFGATLLPIPGLRTAPDDVNVDPDPPVNLVGRFASSAMHVAGRSRASSETLTWLRENFRESPSAAKPQIDRLFTAGINHVIYHGTTYSPPDAPWPGWFFYAASQLKPENPLWSELRGLNDYVARAQAMLTAGRADNDVLLYWPFDDLVDDAAGGMRQLGVHQNEWLRDSSTGQLALALLDAGFAFDFVSDAQLASVAPSACRAIVVPAARRIDVRTLATLRDLRSKGVPVLFAALPEDVPGLGALAARRAALRELLAEPALRDSVAADIPVALAKLGVRRETASARGLHWIRRARDDGADYFLVNVSAPRFDGWLELATPAKQGLLLDPLDGAIGRAALRRDGRGAAVYLQLEPGQSMFVRTFTRAGARARPWRYVTPAGAGAPIVGPWQLTFLAGGPELPAPATLPSPADWTTLDDPRTQSFSGTARYRVTFDAPATPARTTAWLLDLGDVREAARVRLNGSEYAAWSLPFRLRVGALRPTGNVLEVDVTNLPANRIRDLDRRKVDWKIMGDINLASLKYQAFDASRWSVEPSGLLGPVTLTPLRGLAPAR
ncbi:MAG TPA: glycosyl hydrolase [Steroidobacteraceae bacterium]|nr:glycosyl hydrolase [Steroidobacteraceae bacterium]